MAESSDGEPEFEISDEVSPRRKRSCLPQKCWPTSHNWQKCADSFSGLDPLPEKGKTKRKRYGISARLRHRQDQLGNRPGKPLDKHESNEEADLKNDEEIIWSSSDEDLRSSQSKLKIHPFQRHQQKVKCHLLTSSTHAQWPTELSRSFLPQNNPSKSRKAAEKSIPKERKRNLLIDNNYEFLKRKPNLTIDDEDISLDEFDDSDEEIGSKQNQIQKSASISVFSSDEESFVIGCSSGTSSLGNQQGSDVCSRTDVDISSCPSSNLSVERASVSAGGPKTSEWLLALQNRTPTKNINNSAPSSSSQLEKTNLYDSAKKKKRRKYKKDGLAIKLSRIISREKTAMNVWSFRQTELSNESKNVLTVCVHHFSCKVGLVIASCSLGKLSSENVWLPRKEEPHKTVFFNRYTLETLKIQPGSIIRIFPPWQELLVPSIGTKVILCTYYCQLLEPVVDIWEALNETSMDLKRMVCQTFYWNCPCSSSDVPMKYCPALTCPVLTKYPKVKVPEEISVNEESSKCLSSFNIVGSATEDIATGRASTILNSIQAAPTTFQQGLCFQARVLRLFCAQNPSMQNTRKHQRNVQRWSVLVKDSQGSVCIVHLPDKIEESQNSLGQLIQSSEGKTWNFFGLRVFSRSNRHRDPALFSLIDSVWVCPPLQEEPPPSSNESDSITIAQVRPGFCYVTGPSDDLGVESGVIPYRNTFDSNEAENQLKPLLQISTLQEIKQKTNVIRSRLSFVAKIFYFRSKLKESPNEIQSGLSANANLLLFISDPTLSKEPLDQNYMVIHCLPSCYLPSELTLKKSGPVVAFMRDVLLEQDSFVLADGYTRIWSWPPPSNLQQQMVPSVSQEILLQFSELAFPLQSLQESSSCNALFRVQGVVYSVNHKTAVIWETCPFCDKEQLAFKPNDKNEECLVCLNCDIEVNESVTHINLEVIIRCLSLPGHYEVRVNLLQSTVEFLLPKGNHKDGYDVSAVLGQQVGPLVCLLKKQGNTSQQQKPIFYLEEIQSV